VKRRIVAAIMLVATLAVVAFGLPLAVVIDREYEAEALQRLERAAVLAERDIPAGWRPGDALTLDQPGAGTSFGVYGPGGPLVYGSGPQGGDDPVAAAFDDRIGEAEADGEYVIAAPVLDGGQVVAVLRAQQHLAVTDRRIRAAWASMGLLGFAVIAAAGLLARRLARRIATPVEQLQVAATQLGVDGEAVDFPHCGMAELDDVATALGDAAARVADSVERERAFSSEVSHQLRTPITGLRLLLETELVAPRPDPTTVLHEGVEAVERLGSTVEDLLSLSRGRPVDRQPLDVDGLFAELGDRWRPVFAEAGRPLHIGDAAPGAPPVAFASRSAVAHIVDVLVDNALRHGEGDVTVACRPTDGVLSVLVGDEGTADAAVIAGASAPRGAAAGGGRRPIGLGLARRLAHAEGGELVCSSTTPTTFELLLPKL
jgi:signal transduction histidine kinase